MPWQLGFEELGTHKRILAQKEKELKIKVMIVWNFWHAHSLALAAAIAELWISTPTITIMMKSKVVSTIYHCFDHNIN